MKTLNERRQLEGLASSEGVFFGKVRLVSATDSVVHERSISIQRIPFEITEFQRAVQKSVAEIAKVKDHVHTNVGVDEARIFDAHLLMLQDPILIDEVVQRIKQRHKNAEFLFQERFEELCAEFESSAMAAFLKVEDLRDIYNRVMANLTDSKFHLESDSEYAETVYVAHHVTPSFLTSLFGKKKFGVVTESGGYNSHSSIICRSMKIPEVTGVKSITLDINDGDDILVDGTNGIVIINPNEKDIEYYKETSKKAESRKSELLEKKDEQPITTDGRYVKISANIGLPIEASSVSFNGAEGIGLFRSEFLFFSGQLPTEEEQYNSYKEVVDKIRPHTLTIRTLDVGGDKMVKGLCRTDEANPFMGWRSIRISLDRPDIFMTQLRAILRASAEGNVRIMFPMISSVDELEAAMSYLENAKESLDAQGVPFDSKIKIGMMVEVPSAVYQIEDLAEMVDFFSIGTNDLIQFSLAVDRTNEAIAKRFTPYHPGLIRMIKHICDVAKRAHVSTSVCGEMASDPTCIPLLLGLGVEELSMSPWLVLENKELIRKMSFDKMRKLAEETLKFKSLKDVRQFLTLDSKSFS